MKNESEIIDAAHAAMAALCTAISHAQKGDVDAVLSAIDRAEKRTAEMQEMVLDGDAEGAAEADSSIGPCDHDWDFDPSKTNPSCLKCGARRRMGARPT